MPTPPEESVVALMLHLICKYALVWAGLLFVGVIVLWLANCRCQRCGRRFAIYKIDDTSQLCGDCWVFLHQRGGFFT